MCTCTPTNSKSLFSIMCYVLLHFLFLYYTVFSSIMEKLIYIIAFHKSRLGENLLAFLSILLYIYIYIYMRILNTLCISKERKVYVIMLISLLKFWRKISKLPWMEEFWIPVKDVQERGVFRTKLDRGEVDGGGVPKFILFLRTS